MKLPGIVPVRWWFWNGIRWSPCAFPDSLCRLGFGIDHRFSAGPPEVTL